MIVYLHKLSETKCVCREYKQRVHLAKIHHSPCQLTPAFTPFPRNLWNCIVHFQKLTHSKSLNLFRILFCQQVQEFWHMNKESNPFPMTFLHIWHTVMALAEGKACGWLDIGRPALLDGLAVPGESSFVWLYCKSSIDRNLCFWLV